MIKKSKLLISLAILLLFITPAYADIMTSGIKSINQCVKIDNMDEFPDIVLVGYITGPVIQIENPYVIQSDQCLTQYYKANELTIYAIEKDYFDSVGIEHIDFESELYVKAYKMEKNLDSRTISLTNTLTAEEIHYSIAGFNDEGLVLYESERITSYVADIQKVEKFEKPEIPDLRLTINDSSTDEEVIEPVTGEQEETNEFFVDSIVLFFNRLFGTRY
ncbi:hypothetical protein [Methanolobus sp.]|jgi:hypothetical protein|uniref:hypothetical protein n=1 Tax=Methanolobus sp. TaxID=1874737 RepID=UPI0025E9C9C5|nr:hypothetical protein [Methanolobus sp.]